MNKFIGLDNFTLKQKELLNKTSGVVEFSEGSGRTSACFTVATSFCRGNNNIKACLVTKDYDEVDAFVEDINTLDTVDVDKNDERCIIKFPDTESTLVVCRYDNKHIYLPNGNITEYGKDLYFKYTLMYFDGISPMDIYLEHNDCHPMMDMQNKAVLDYLSSCVKERVVFCV